MHLISTALFDLARRSAAFVSGTAAAFTRPASIDRPRRGMLLAASALAVALALPGQPTHAQNWNSERWTGTWGTTRPARRQPVRPRSSPTRPCD